MPGTGCRFPGILPFMQALPARHTYDLQEPPYMFTAVLSYVPVYFSSYGKAQCLLLRYPQRL